MNPHRAAGALMAATLLVCATAACQDPPPPVRTDVVDPGTPAPLPPSPTPAGPVAPLTGRPATGPAAAARSTVAVPMRITAGSAPAGLGAADMIFEEYAEGGSLHLSAVFQSRDAAKIGPISEIRPVDIRSLKILNSFIGYAGGPRGFVTQLAAAGLSAATPGQQPKAFSGGYTSTARLYAAAPAGHSAPPVLFDFAGAAEPLATTGVKTAVRLTVAAPGHATQVWQYDPQTHGWRSRLGTVDVTATTVVVLGTEYREATIRKPRVHNVPSAKVFGDGLATTVSGPASVHGKWRKSGEDAACFVTDSTGDLVHPLPGPVWVVYAPTNAKVTVQ